MKKTFTGVLSGIVTIAAFALCTMSACEKQDGTNCFNAQLARDYANVSCPTKCNTTVGCDGKPYCNSCTAAKAGIFAN